MNNLTNLKQYLESWGALTPWLVLIPVLMLFEFATTKSRLFVWLEATYPWGAPARKAIHAAPTVIFGALFDFLTTGSGDIDSMVAGGMLGLLLHYKPPKPPASGAAVGLVLLCLGCGPKAEPVTPAERKACVDLAEQRKDLELSSCGDNREGACSPELIADRRKDAGQKCLGGK